MSGGGIHNDVRDLTARQASGGGGMSMYRTFSRCPITHKGPTTGAQYVRGLGFVRCAACNAARKAAA